MQLTKDHTKNPLKSTKQQREDKNVRTGRKIKEGTNNRNVWKQHRAEIKKGSLQNKEKKAYTALKSDGHNGALERPKSNSLSKMAVNDKKVKSQSPEGTQKFMPISDMIDPIKAAKENSTMMDMTVAQKWKLPAIKGADAIKGGFFDSPIGGFEGGFRRSSDISLAKTTPEHTMAILTDIAQHKKKRMQQELRDKLHDITNRVKAALFNAGIEEDEDDVQIDKKLATLQMVSLESRNKRQKIDERRDIIDNINEYLGSCKERYGLLENVATWINYAQDELEKDLLSGEEYDKAMTNAEIDYNNTKDDMYIFTENIDKFKYLSQMFLRYVRKISDKKEKHQAPKILVLDDQALLSGKVNWDAGIANVNNLLEEASEWVKGIPMKNAIKNSKMQYTFIVKAMDKKLNDLAIATKNFEDSKIKLSLVSTREESYVKDQSEARREILTLKNSLDDLTNQLRMAQDKNDKLLLKIGQLEIVIGDLKIELAKLPPTPPPTPPPILIPEPQPESLAHPSPLPTPPPLPPPSPPSVPIGASVTNELNEKIENLEDEISNYKVVIGELQDRIMMLEDNVAKEQNKLEMLKESLDKANITPPLAPCTTPELKMDIKMDIQPEKTVDSGSNNQHQPDSQGVKMSEASANYYKTLLSGIKKDFLQEMERLKEYAKKESQRTEAAVRRVENSHKDQIAVFQKDALRILRALTHFKDQLVIALEKEGHAESAKQLSRLPKLIPDDIKTDHKDILSRMTIGCVEFLHGIESILNHTLMTIRIMGKLNAGQGNEGDVMKQMVELVEKMKKGKSISKGTTERPQIKQKKLKEADQKEVKYLSLSGRYKVVWTMFLNMTKEMNVLEDDFEETLEDVAENEDPVIISAMKIEAKKFRQKNKAEKAGGEVAEREVSFVSQTKNTKTNIKTLEKALDDGKITQDLFEKSKKSLKECLRFHEERFQSLVKSYVKFKALQQFDERSKKLLSGDVYLPTAKREDLKKLTQKIHTRLLSELNQEKTVHDEIKEQLNKVIQEASSICSDVLLHTGIQLIQPQKIQSDKGHHSIKHENKKDRKAKKEICYIFGTEKTKTNLRKLERALEGGKINYDLFEKSKESLKECLRFPKIRFQSLVKNYIKFKALQQFDERSKKLLSGDVYLPTAKREDLKKLTQKIHTRLLSELNQEKVELAEINQQLNEVNREAWEICNDVTAITGIQLMQPIMVQIDKGDHVIFPKLALHHQRRMEKILNYRKTVKTLELPSLVKGKSITLRNKLFNIDFERQSLKTPVGTMVTTPLLVDLEVNKDRNTAKRVLSNLKRERFEIPLARARSYHVTQDWRLQYINEIAS